ncbi:SH3 domain-containing protein [Acinetobacter sp. MB5]|uniref:SH3 domain-containing protein n=1 Tax=Acinetobacter sp. MB5 TaxID=2069438 RepID=UPI000DCFF1DE|nr:SH3 domain-containing protein [Acinetobacter sp. MB5]
MRKYICILFFLLSFNVFAESSKCIVFEKNYSQYDNQNMYDLDAYITDCHKKSKKIETFGYFGDSPKVNYYFFQKNNNINRLFISTYVLTDQYEENPKYVYENGKYNFIRVFDCIDFNCKVNKKMTDFLGDGANLVDFKNHKTVWKYPYVTADSLKKELTSNFFKKWMENQLKDGVIKNRTEIYSDSGINSTKLGYLISGDKFNIVDVTSRWLKISYKAKNKKAIIGWINCESTNVCS